MIYKDLFRIFINGEEYKENSKQFFTLEEMKDVWLKMSYHEPLNTFEIKYDPILTEDILSEEEIYGYSEEDLFNEGDENE